MNRNTFLKRSALLVAGLPLASSFIKFPRNQQPSKELLMGKGSPNFLGDSFKLEAETYHALVRMQEAARLEGIQIEVVSAYRSYERQLQIWTGKYNRFTAAGMSPQAAMDKIIEYSTIPGTSRHHWGTDIDLIDQNAPRPTHVLEPEHFHGKGPFCKFKDWMNLHANSFGFYEVYTNNAHRKGFKYEPWHFSYKPTSHAYLKAYKQLDIKKELQQDAFAGTEHFTETFIDNYIQNNILDINPALKSE